MKGFKSATETPLLIMPLDTHSETAGVRLCIHCDTEIPPARLKAMPTAASCVPCLEVTGDVAKIRRHDDHVGKNGEEVVETFFKKPTPYIERFTNRMTKGVLTFHGSDDQEEVHTTSVKPGYWPTSPEEDYVSSIDKKKTTQLQKAA